MIEFLEKSLWQEVTITEDKELYKNLLSNANERKLESGYLISFLTLYNTLFKIC